MFGFRLNPKEPKDPPLITRFTDRLKKSKAYEMTFNDAFREKALFEAKKKMEAKKFEDRLTGRAREKFKDERLKRKRFKNKLFPRVEDL